MSQDLTQFITEMENGFDAIAPDTLRADTKLADIGDLDSLGVLVLVGMVKLKYDKTIDGMDVSNSKTIKDLYDVILSK